MNFIKPIKFFMHLFVSNHDRPDAGSPAACTLSSKQPRNVEMTNGDSGSKETNALIEVLVDRITPLPIKILEQEPKRLLLQIHLATMHSFQSKIYCSKMR